MASVVPARRPTPDSNVHARCPSRAWDPTALAARQPLELLTNWIAVADDESVSALTHTLYVALGNVPPEMKENLWEAWVQEYVRRRIEGLPRALAPGEGRALIELILRFPSQLGDVIETMEQNLPAEPRREVVYFRLTEKLAGADPDSAARLLLLLLRAETSDEYFDRSSAGEVAESLLGSASTEVLHKDR